MPCQGPTPLPTAPARISRPRLMAHWSVPGGSELPSPSAPRTQDTEVTNHSGAMASRRARALLSGRPVLGKTLETQGGALGQRPAASVAAGQATKRRRSPGSGSRLVGSSCPTPTHTPHLCDGRARPEAGRGRPSSDSGPGFSVRSVSRPNNPPNSTSRKSQFLLSCRMR